MLKEEKRKQVKKQLRSGYPEGELKNELRKEGFTEEEINQLFAPHKYDMRSWYLGSAIVMLLVWIAAGDLMIIIFSGVMFALYYSEYKRMERDNR